MIFNRLTKENAEKIISLLLDKVRERIKNIGVDITFSPEVAKALSELSYNKQFGARPLARLITTRIENPLSDKLLSGEINEEMLSYVNSTVLQPLQKKKKAFHSERLFIFVLCLLQHLHKG